MPKCYWLVKQEPESYPWEAFVRDGGSPWTGVRSFPARSHLRGMARGDAVLYYHSGEERRIVGLAKVARAAYPDPTATEGDWVAVDLVPTRALPRPVTLQSVKADPHLREMTLVRQSRLSVMPVTAPQFQRILALGGSRAST